MSLADLPDQPRPCQPKPPKGTASADREQRRTALAKVERVENAKVKARSGGRCEVVVADRRTGWGGGICVYPCVNTATQVHHMIGGRGRRGVGISALAEHKQDVCDQCHLDITGDIGGKRLILQEAGPVPVWTDSYRRVK